ncbi:MAG: DUF4349 domain-containing protein [Acidimicrobiales bacterium]
MTATFSLLRTTFHRLTPPTFARLWRVFLVGAVLLVGAVGLATAHSSPATTGETGSGVSTGVAHAPSNAKVVRGPTMGAPTPGVTQGLPSSSTGSLGIVSGTDATGGASATGGLSTPSIVQAQPSGVPPLPSAVTGQSTRIEETGNAEIVVSAKAIEPDLSRLTAVAQGAGGFVSNSGESGGDGLPAQGTITLEVPVATFSSVLAEVRGLGKVAQLSTQATDVTGQYVDLQARISALQASRQQYLTILSKATSIGDILSVQSQLDDIQSQLEQLQGQQQVLDSETTYASLVVSLTQHAIVAPRPVPESGIASAWHSAVNGFVSGVEGVIRVAGPLLFALLLIGALVVAGRGLWRMRGRRAGAAVS